MQENYACSIINVCEIKISNDTSSINNTEHIFGIKNACIDANQYICECCDYNTAIKIIMTNIYRLKNIQKLCSKIIYYRLKTT